MYIYSHGRKPAVQLGPKKGYVFRDRNRATEKSSLSNGFSAPYLSAKMVHSLSGSDLGACGNMK